MALLVLIVKIKGGKGLDIGTFTPEVGKGNDLEGDGLSVAAKTCETTLKLVELFARDLGLVRKASHELVASSGRGIDSFHPFSVRKLCEIDQIRDLDLELTLFTKLCGGHLMSSIRSVSVFFPLH